MRVTIKKIAQELGISHSTVSRVLNDKQSNLVSETTRNRIMQAATRLGYRPSRIAQALQGKQTNLIGVFMPDRDDYFFQDVVKHLRRTVEHDGYELIVFSTPSTRISANWYRLLQWDLDGAFVFDYLFYVDGLWEALTQHTGHIPPIVGLFSQQTQLQDYITIDFQRALKSLLQHLVDQGCRRFGYMAFPTSFDPVEQRYAVFSDFVQQHGLHQIDIPVLTGPEPLMEAARLGLRAWSEEGEPFPDAIFCQNDEIALGAYRALRDAGISVPDQIALAGCDDLPYISYLETPLTSISLPVPEVCRQGWSVLQQRMASPEGPPLQVVLEVDLKLRASCQKG